MSIMHDAWLLYALWSLLLALTVLLVFVWLHKIITLIVANYILASIGFSISMGIDALITYLESMWSVRFVGITADSWANFFLNGHATIVFLIYILLLIRVYKRSTLSRSVSIHHPLHRTAYVFLVPLTLLSFILTFYILARGSGILSVDILQSRSTSSPIFSVLANILSLFPVWVVIHGLLILLLSVRKTVHFDADMTDI